MEISAPDLANMRAGNSEYELHLNVMPKTVIGTARINQSLFQYPLGGVTVDTVALNGGLSDLTEVPAGSMVYIGTSDGDNDILTSFARKQSIVTELYIVGKSFGDTGQPVAIAAALADDQYVTVFAQQPIWPLMSIIRGGVLYKNFDIEYTDQNNNPSPIGNIGTWERHDCPVGGTVDVTFAEGDSVYWPGYANDGYQWSQRNGSYLTSGASVVGGGETTSTVTYRFDPGFYIVSLEITSDNGSTHIATKYVWAVDGVVEKDFDGWHIKKDSQDIFGRTISLDLSGAFDLDDLMPHTAAMFSEVPTFNGETVTTGSTVTKFCGFLENYRTERNVPVINKTDFEVVGPGVLLKMIPAAAQYIRHSADPAVWYELEPGMVDTNGRTWYTLNYHCPAILALFDFVVLPSDSLVRKTTTTNSDTIMGQIEEQANQRVSIGWLSDGTLIIKRMESLLGTSTERDAVDEKMTWGAQDIRDQLQIRALTRLKVGKLDGLGFDFSDLITVLPYWARSPGNVQAPGKGRLVFNGLTVINGTDLQQLTGNLYARNNQPVDHMTIKVVGNLDTAEPALNEWHRLTTPASLSPMGQAIDDRMTPVKVNRTWRRKEGGAYAKEIKTSFALETQGLLALNKQILTSANKGYLPQDSWSKSDLGGFDFQTGFVPQPEGPGITAGLQQIIGVSSDKTLYRTYDYQTVSASGGPDYSDAVLLALTGTPWQFVVDAFSPGYAGTGTNVNGWIATSDKIYRVEDMQGVTPGVTDQFTFRASTLQRNMDFSFGVDGWGICVSFYPSEGVWVTYTQDGGTTWSTEAAITTFYNVPGADFIYPALYVSSKTPGLAYAEVYTVTGAQNNALTGTYRTTDYGATWALYTGLNIDAGHAIGQEFHFPYEGNPNEDICYYTKTVFGDGYIFNRTVGTGTPSSVSPFALPGTDPGDFYGGYNPRFSITSSAQDRNYMVMSGRRTGSGIVQAIHSTTDGGINWSVVWTNTGNRNQYDKVAISGSDKNVLYLFGGTGIIVASRMRMAYSTDLGVNIDDRTGNLPGTDGQFIGIAGGLA